MSFVYPGFLIALSALAIPVIIHLFNFRRYKTVLFTNVRFLREVKEETLSRNKLRHLLILLSRILAILFLVFAFAQPFIPARNQLSFKGRKAVSIYIDNSFSMDALNRSGTLLDDAKKKAKEVAGTFEVSDVFQLLTNDFEGRHQRLVSRDEFLELVDEVKSSPSVRKMSEVIIRQKDALGQEPGAQKVSFLLSDFQKSVMDMDNFKNDTSLLVHPVPIVAQSSGNVYVDSVWFSSPVHQLDVPEKISVSIKNLSTNDIENSAIKLYINGQQKSPGSFSVEAGGAQNTILSFTSREAGLHACYVSINDHPLTFDDTYYFSFRINKQIPVLCISPNMPDTSTKSIRALYRDTLFKLSLASERSLDFASFPDYRMIILNQLPEISSGMISELKKFSAYGGHIFFFPSSSGKKESYSAFLSSLGANPTDKLDTAKYKVDKLNHEHPLFTDVFEEIPKKIDLPVANKHWVYKKNSRIAEEPLMNLQNGDAFLSIFPSGSGRIYVSAVGLDEGSGNFARHAIFVPIMIQAAVNSVPGGQISYTLSRDEIIKMSAGKILQGDLALHLKGEKGFDVIPEHRIVNNELEIDVHGQINNAGNYMIYIGDSAMNSVSFNFDRKESDLSSYTVTEINDQLRERGLTSFRLIETGLKSMSDILQEADQGKPLWKYCILFVLIFAACEAMLIRFLK